MIRTERKRGAATRGRATGVLARVLALAAGGLPALASCSADVNSSLVIVQNQVPETEDGACIIPSKRDNLRRFSGVYDVDLDQDYPFFMFPLVRNNLPAISEDNAVELNRIEYTGVEVQIEPPPGITFPSTEACPSAFAESERVSLAPDEERSSMVRVFQPCHSATLRAMFNQGTLPDDPAALVQFRAVVRAIGRHAGKTVESDPFEYAVRVCKGCLQRGYQEAFAVFDYPKVPKCTALSANPYSGNACNPAQDSLILCCERQLADNSTKLECPGRPQPPPATSP
ncbi:MAG: hypothetical protein KA712_23425 [Myxococcales bacterium]|nr:hypothetical protein [Myxococcales bacterium]